MKKIYASAMLLLAGINVVAQSPFFKETCYRGAFAPAPASMWTDTWTEWDPQNKIYASPTVTVTANITTNTTWTSNNVYLLQGQIFVKSGATLTIQPGTVIMGDKSVAGSGLFISKGSKIMAQGTLNQPIVFTSNQPAGQRGLGDWGGLILLGNASNNIAGGLGYVEGLAQSADTEYGNATPDDNDNSGVIEYVRIEFGGYVYQPNKEINGLTMGSVGRGTTINYVQVSFVNDDAYEWFGGTVNCSHLVSYRNLDDDFDTDNGFRGNVQFGLSVRDPQIADNPSVSTSEGFESDNDASGSTNSPQTAALFSNMTLIGPYRGNTGSSIATGYRRAARIRRNSGLKIFNSVLMDHPRGVHIDGALCETNAANGALKFMHNIVAGNTTGMVCERNAGSSFNIWSWFASGINDSLVSSAGILTSPYNYTAPDYRPAGTSPAMGGASFSDAAFTGLVNTIPLASFASSPDTICMGSSVTFTDASSNTPTTWNWTITGPAAFTSALQNPVIAFTVSGSYTVTLVAANANGSSCSYSQIINVMVYALPPVPTISASGVILTSSSGSGNQWYLNGTAITGATATTYTMTQNGSYTVVVTNSNGCSSTSQAYIITNIGLNEVANRLSSISVYPNPATDNVKINLNTVKENTCTVVVYNPTGEVMEVLATQLKINGEYILNLHTSAYNNGIYFIQVQTAHEVKTLRLIINK